MAKFAVSSLQPVGRQRTYHGRKLHGTFENNHCRVEYTERKSGLHVEVHFPDGYVAKWETIAAYPSVEVAKMAATAAHRNRRP